MSSWSPAVRFTANASLCTIEPESSHVSALNGISICSAEGKRSAACASSATDCRLRMRCAAHSALASLATCAREDAYAVHCAALTSERAWADDFSPFLPNSRGGGVQPRLGGISQPGENASTFHHDVGSPRRRHAYAGAHSSMASNH